MPKKQIKIAITPEAYGVYFSRKLRTADDRMGFLADPKLYLLSHLNVDFTSDVEVIAAANSDTVMHLALPYYSGLEAAKARSLDEIELLDAVSGGDIISLLIMIFGSAAGIALAGSGVAAGTIFPIMANK